MSEPIIYGEADERTIAQIKRRQAAEEGARAVLCADNHLGYSQPIGGAVAYRDHISPSGVGYDIGCGNKAVRTNIRVTDIAGMEEGGSPRVAPAEGTSLNIELRGAAADEAPPAYKRLDEVLAAQGDTIRILHRLRPIGVAMAGPDIYDKYKD